MPDYPLSRRLVTLFFHGRAFMWMLAIQIGLWLISFMTFLFTSGAPNGPPVWSHPSWFTFAVYLVLPEAIGLGDLPIFFALVVVGIEMIVIALYVSAVVAFLKNRWQAIFKRKRVVSKG